MVEKKYKHMIHLEDQVPKSMERRSKLISVKEAGKVIASKKSLSVVGSHSSNAPMTLIREAIRAGIKDITFYPPTAISIAPDILIAAGCIKKLYVSYIGFEFIGFAPAFRKAAQGGTIEVVEADEPFIRLGYQAAAGGRPYNVVQYLYEATDHPKLNPELRKTIDPFTGREVYAIPPLRSEICLLHAQAADQYGNIQCWGGNRQEPDQAKAADMVIVQADEIVSVDTIAIDPSKSTIPGLWVDYVVHTPFGAHPTFSPRNYAMDEDHLREYVELVRNGNEREYLDKYVLGPKDQYEYMKLIGLEKLFSLRRMLAV